jgi:hypothetical protein
MFSIKKLVSSINTEIPDVNKVRNRIFKIQINQQIHLIPVQKKNPPKQQKPSHRWLLSQSPIVPKSANLQILFILNELG